MGISLSTARWAAPAAYGINFIVQMIGMQSKPNMLDIHNLRFAAFSPYAFAIPLFFGGQQLLQVRWIYRLWKDQGVSAPERQAALDYAPTFILGNLCIATWLLFWNKNQLTASHICVTINSLAQLYHVAFKLPPRSAATNLTHYTAKTFAGIGLLDFVHNASAAFFTGVPPSTLVKVSTGLVAAAGVAASDWIFGACIAYDLAALAVGQSSAQPEWSSLLGLYAGGAAVWSALKYRSLRA